MGSLLKTNINSTAVNAMKDLYTNCMSKIKKGNRVSAGFEFTKGL